MGSMPLTLSFSPIPENSIYSFVRLFKKFLLSTYYVLGIGLEAADDVVNADKALTLIIDVNQIT